MKELNLHGKQILVDGEEYKDMVRKLEICDTKSTWVQKHQTGWGNEEYWMITGDEAVSVLMEQLNDLRKKHWRVENENTELKKELKKKSWWQI